MTRPIRPFPAALGAAALAVVLAMAVAACGSGAASPSPATSDQSGSAQATGLVTDIVTSGPVEVASFIVRTEDGETLEFTVGTLDVTGGGFPAEHLSEHRLAAEPVLVLYRDEGGKHVAYKLLDAEAAPSAS